LKEERQAVKELKFSIFTKNSGKRNSRRKHVRNFKRTIPTHII
jgi:hypothetical protein